MSDLTKAAGFVGKNVIATTVHMFMGTLERIESIGEVDVAVIRTRPPTSRVSGDKDGLRWVPLDGRNKIEGDIIQDDQG